MKDWFLKLWCLVQAGRERFASVSVDDLISLPPGHARVLEDGETGHQWAVMHLDDFDHICDRAGLKRKRLSETASEGQ